MQIIIYVVLCKDDQVDVKQWKTIFWPWPFVTFKITFVFKIMDGNTAYGFVILRTINIAKTLYLFEHYQSVEHGIVGLLRSRVLFCGCHLIS